MECMACVPASLSASLSAPFPMSMPGISFMFDMSWSGIFMPGMLELLGWVLGWAGCVWLQATLDRKKAVTRTIIRLRISKSPLLGVDINPGAGQLFRQETGGYSGLLG